MMLLTGLPGSQHKGSQSAECETRPETGGTGRGTEEERGGLLTPQEGETSPIVRDSVWDFFTGIL